ncbi:MAG: DUF4382 domain-containing protein [Oligoflexia bacterium]|nr:DUF4382 domain-containing protein [Oligoflexia bacterium]
MVTHGKLKVLTRAEGRESVPPSMIAAEIGIQKIEARSVEGNWFRFVIEPVRIDLLNPSLEAGMVLARAKLPIGSYDLIRFVTEASGTARFDDGTELPLTIPSGEQSGLKVFFDGGALAISDSQAQQATFTFDLQDVFHFGRDGVMMRPVLRVEVSVLEIPTGDSGSTDSSTDGTVDNGDAGSADGSTDSSGSNDGSAGTEDPAAGDDSSPTDDGGSDPTSGDGSSGSTDSSTSDPTSGGDSTNPDTIDSGWISVIGL